MTCDSFGDSQKSAELYDPATDTWIIASNMNDARRNYTASVLTDGKVSVAGGGYDDIYSNRTELYNPAAVA